MKGNSLNTKSLTLGARDMQVQYGGLIQELIQSRNERHLL